MNHGRLLLITKQVAALETRRWNIKWASNTRKYLEKKIHFDTAFKSRNFWCFPITIWLLLSQVRQKLKTVSILKNASVLIFSLLAPSYLTVHRIPSLYTVAVTSLPFIFWLSNFRNKGMGLFNRNIPSTKGCNFPNKIYLSPWLETLSRLKKRKHIIPTLF